MRRFRLVFHTRRIAQRVVDAACYHGRYACKRLRAHENAHRSGIDRLDRHQHSRRGPAQSPPLSGVCTRSREQHRAPGLPDCGIPARGRGGRDLRRPRPSIRESGVRRPAAAGLARTAVRATRRWSGFPPPARSIRSSRRSWAWRAWKRPTKRSCRGKRVGLANKEVLVSAGSLVMEAVREHGAELIPVDSEHNGAHQCLRAGNRQAVSKLILTASGGPFRNTPSGIAGICDTGAGSESSNMEDGQPHHDRFRDSDEQRLRSDRGLLAVRFPAVPGGCGDSSAIQRACHDRVHRWQCACADFVRRICGCRFNMR